MNMQTNVNSIKLESIYAYKYDYINSSLRNTHITGSVTLTTSKSKIESAFAQS